MHTCIQHTCIQYTYKSHAASTNSKKVCMKPQDEDHKPDLNSSEILLLLLCYQKSDHRAKEIY